MTLVEALDRVLARVAGTEISRFLEHQHRGHGIDLRLNAQVAHFEGDDFGINSAHLADGTILQCDFVVVGIGIEPNVGPLADAGAAISNGVEVDSFCRTNLPDIYAIGDCAAHSNAFADCARIRLESVQNASDMATVVAKTLCGVETPYAAIPWFWSNQLDIKLQTIGLSTGHDATIMHGAPEEKSFSVTYLKNGRVIARDCINATRDYVDARKLIEAQARFDVVERGG